MTREDYIRSKRSVSASILRVPKPQYEARYTKRLLEQHVDDLISTAFENVSLQDSHPSSATTALASQDLRPPSSWSSSPASI